MSNRTTAPDAVAALTVLNRRSPAQYSSIVVAGGIAVAGVLALAAV
jgi:hypothetical protein